MFELILFTGLAVTILESNCYKYCSFYALTYGIGSYHQITMKISGEQQYTH